MAHVTFVHGIANKPPADALLHLWSRSLACDGVDRLARAPDDDPLERAMAEQNRLHRLVAAAPIGDRSEAGQRMAGPRRP